MDTSQVLQGKKILIVDDEPDILESLEELLDMCDVDTAADFESAKALLEVTDYDVSVLDIMGVNGYELLKIAVARNIPAIMLTAHALSAESFVKSMKTGADAYVPKDKITDIAFYVADSIRVKEEKNKKGPGKWFTKLQPFFDKRFGPGWLEKYQNIWD